MAVITLVAAMIIGGNGGGTGEDPVPFSEWGRIYSQLREEARAAEQAAAQEGVPQQLPTRRPPPTPMPTLAPVGTVALAGTVFKGQVDSTLVQKLGAFRAGRKFPSFSQPEIDLEIDLLKQLWRQSGSRELLHTWMTLELGKARPVGAGAFRTEPTLTPIPTPGPTLTPSAYSNYAKGEDYFGDGKYQLAINEFTSAIRLNPNYTDAYWYRGVAYYHLGNPCGQSRTTTRPSS